MVSSGHPRVAKFRPEGDWGWTSGSATPESPLWAVNSMATLFASLLLFGGVSSALGHLIEVAANLLFGAA